MKITKNIILKNTATRQDNKLLLNLSKLQLGSVKNMEEHIQADSVAIIDLDSNYLKVIDADLNKFQSLESLTVQFNFLEDSLPIASLINLIQLNLSTNRFKHLVDLSMLVHLTFLDVSNNSIVYIQKLPLGLQTFIGNHNQLEQCSFLPQNIHVVELASNQITNIISLANNNQLVILNLQNNRIPANHFSDFLYLLQKYLKDLKQLVLLENPVVNSSDYMMEILGRRNLEKLDHIIITPYIYKAFSELKHQKDIVEIVKETKEEYNRRIRQELELKNQLLEALRKKQQFIEQTFNNYRNSNRKDIDNFMDYANNKLLKDGKDLQYERELMKSFENRLKQAEADNQLIANSRKINLKAEQKILMTNKINLRSNAPIYTSPDYSKLPDVVEVNSEHQKENPQRDSSVNQALIPKKYKGIQNKYLEVSGQPQKKQTKTIKQDTNSQVSSTIQIKKLNYAELKKKLALKKKTKLQHTDIVPESSSQIYEPQCFKALKLNYNQCV